MKLDLNPYLRAQKSIAQDALTNSKRAECFVKGVYPTHFVEARGPFAWDTKGNKYIDFVGGLGSCILGFANHQVAAAKYNQDMRGSTLSLSSVLELDLAEKLKEILPWIDKVKFLKTGSEACSGALRIARAKTGRDLIFSDGYHGWHDPFISLVPPGMGIPEQRGISKLTSLDQISESTAGVIVEPIISDISQERIDYLKALRDRCTKVGAMLIFDEIITGFRTPKFFMCEYFGIEPDIIVMGKAMGNGSPISCIAGKKEVMDCGEYFVSSTFAGETVSIAAAITTINLLQKDKRFNLTLLWERGAYFQDRFNSLDERLKIKGYPSRGVFEGDPLFKALFWQEAIMAGLFFGSSFFFNFSHIPVMENTLNIINDIMTKLKTKNVQLRGDMPSSPFAQKMRENAQRTT